MDHDGAGLAAFGWDDEVAERWAAATSDASGAVAPGRVVRADHGKSRVVTEDGTLHLHTAQSKQEPVIGDWVAVDPEGTFVVDVLPRSSALIRSASGRPSQVLAANVDTIFVVLGADRPFKPRKLERMLLLAWESGAEPRIVLTKSDVLTDEGLAERQAVIASVGAGVPIMPVSVVDGRGIDDLRSCLAGGRTGVLVGESGAGKSSLVNVLVGHDIQHVQQVRDIDAKGRHTTTSRELFTLQDGGVIIDTPGIRTIGVIAGDDAVSATFPDIDELAADCRYRDCGHAHEPDCAVRSAAEEGTLDPARLESYLDLQKEIAFEASKGNPRNRRKERVGGRLRREVKRAKREALDQ